MSKRTLVATPLGSPVAVSVACDCVRSSAPPVVAAGGPAARATAAAASSATTAVSTGSRTRRIVPRDTGARPKLRLGPPAGLTEERAGRLLEDLAPGAGLLLLGGQGVDDVAHARPGDLAAVALAGPLDPVVGRGEPQRHGLEAVAGDVHALG